MAQGVGPEFKSQHRKKENVQHKRCLWSRSSVERLPSKREALSSVTQRVTSPEGRKFGVVGPDRTVV
jgi:hypothetical protein